LLAGLSTPLVLSVHSIVSFDFAVSVVPGWELASETSSQMCVSAVDSYLGGPPDSETDVFYYMPSEGGWNSGDHNVTCFVGSWSGRTTGSLRSGAQGSGIGV